MSESEIKYYSAHAICLKSCFFFRISFSCYTFTFLLSQPSEGFYFFLTVYILFNMCYKAKEN